MCVLELEICKQLFAICSGNAHYFPYLEGCTMKGQLLTYETAK